MLLLRPVYVIAMCDVYADYLDESEQTPDFGTAPSNGISALVTFLCVCLFVAVLHLYRESLGIIHWLSIVK